MFTRSIHDVEATEWGSGTSHRVITATDKMGFALARTIVRAGSESKLEYRNHLEACYCIVGSGNVEDTQGNVYPVVQGTVYVLDNHDAHYLRASEHEDMELLSIFNPAIRGDEKHTLSPDGISSY